MKTTLANLGLPTEAPEVEVRKLHDDPLFQSSRAPTVKARSAILAQYQAILDDIGSKIGRVSNLPLTVKMKVEPVPSFKEAASPGAYYEPPPLDDSRPGVFYVNLSLPQFTYGMRTLAYHEGIPGHHYQITTARHQKDLPMFRQIVPFNSYSEGWALWAEQVAADRGRSVRPAWIPVGAAAARVAPRRGHRHAREAVDPRRGARILQGAHDEQRRGERDRDRSLHRVARTGVRLHGKKTIERLADEARAQLGATFDLRAFNDVVLSAEAVPMPVLKGIVERWLTGQKGH